MAHNMAETAHKSYRLPTDLLQRLEGYAKAHGMRASEAVAFLLSAALEASEEATQAPARPDNQKDEQIPKGGDGGPYTAPHDGTQGGTQATDAQAVIDVLRESNADLRATVSTLTAQLAVKDEQIGAAHDLASHAQMLHAADAQRLMGDGGEIVAADGMTWRQRLGRWIAGR